LETGISARLTPAEGRKFGLVVGGAFLLLGAVSRWRGHDTAPYVLWTIGSLLFAGGLVAPTRLGPVRAGWMRFAHGLSKITTPIFMGVIYFVVLTPVGLFRRLLGWNSLVRPRGDTFWLTRPAGSGRKSDLERQF
jgi:hypothetical protein